MCSFKRIPFLKHKIVIVFIDDYPNDSSVYLTEIIDLTESPKFLIKEKMEMENLLILL